MQYIVVLRLCLSYHRISFYHDNSLTLPNNFGLHAKQSCSDLDNIMCYVSLVTDDATNTAVVEEMGLEQCCQGDRGRMRGGRGGRGGIK